MKFSIIFPTRGNVERLQWSLNFIVGTTTDINNVEVIIGVDDDDKKMMKFEFPYLTLKKVVFVRKPYFGEYYNELLNHVTGDVIWVWSDENALMTKGWDKIAEKAIKRSRWDVWIGEVGDYVTDDQHRAVASGHPLTGVRFSCYPMLSRAAVEALGYLHPPFFRMWGADLYLSMLFQQVARVIDLKGIEVKSKISDKDNKLEIYKEDVLKMVEDGRAKFMDEDRVAYNMGPDILKLKKRMGEVRCHKPNYPSLEGLNHFQFFTANVKRIIVSFLQFLGLRD